MSIKARFEKFTKEIKPTPKHIDEANRQTNYMIERLKNKVVADGSFELEKVLKAGSNAKFTSLRKTEENLFDVDLGAYYSGKGATKERLDTLIQFTRGQVRAIYPTKEDKDFEKLKSAVRVKFRSGIELNVDIAPIICDDSLKVENGGWIPRPDAWRLTSVTAHNLFVQKRTGESNKTSGPVKFNRLVRMVKWWNNLQGGLVQPSIFCELITAKAFKECGVTGEWQTSLDWSSIASANTSFWNPLSSAITTTPQRSNSRTIKSSLWIRSTRRTMWPPPDRRDAEQIPGQRQETYDAMMEARSAELDDDEEAAVNAWCSCLRRGVSEVLRARGGKIIHASSYDYPSRYGNDVLYQRRLYHP